MCALDYHTIPCHEILKWISHMQVIHKLLYPAPCGDSGIAYSLIWLFKLLSWYHDSIMCLFPTANLKLVSLGSLLHSQLTWQHTKKFPQVHVLVAVVLVNPPLSEHVKCLTAVCLVDSVLLNLPGPPVRNPRQLWSGYRPQDPVTSLVSWEGHLLGLCVRMLV